MSKIYTKTGDNGTTSLLKGVRKSKKADVFEVLGGLDELNAVLGFVAGLKDKTSSQAVHGIQNDLFVLGSYMAGVLPPKNYKAVWEMKIVAMEKLIDAIDKNLPPLQNFILPGGSPAAANFHLARAVCRRVERNFVKYVSGKKVFQIYLNRLSDLLFVLARYSNKKSKYQDIIWRA